MVGFPEAIAQSMERTISELQRLCRQPSISAQHTGIVPTVRLITAMIESLGGTTKVLNGGGGNPVICADFEPDQGDSNRTLLYYNHYDVQPPEPVDQWSSPPFSAELRDGKIYARGAADNKGDLVARLAAIRLLKANGGLPCRVKFLIEGEEEIGSPSIGKVTEMYGPLFAADACIWEFGDVDARGRPQVYGGVKGMAYLQLWCRVANVDLHSAMGVLVEGAAWRLTHALATLKDARGRITIDGFYEDVRVPNLMARRLADKIPFEGDSLRTRLGLTRPFLTETLDQDVTQAFCFQPTCTICGLESGYYGSGSKTVLPRAAQAKIDCRLVPDQEPDDILRKVRRQLNAQGFEDIELELVNGTRPFLTDPDDPFVAVVRDTAREAWGAEPVYHPSSAGTGPMQILGSALKIPIVSTGCGWFGGRAHAPDESIRLADIEKGILHQMLLLTRFGQS